WYLLLTRIFSVLFLVGLVMGAFLYGRTDGFQSDRVNTSQVERLSQLLDRSDEELRTLRRSAAVLERGAEVDREAAERVRQTNRELRDEIASLEQEVRLYRGIMAPEENGVGPAVDEFAIQNLSENSYRFALIMTHAGSDGSWLEGSVGVNIVGENANGEREVFPLMDVSPEYDRVDIRLRYRYFQEIRGEMTFPEGFTPQQIRVVAQVTGNRAATRDVELEWDELGVL
ncbi:MAG: DUF6776 family protein, partial [Natronospirillum sp.]